MRVWTIKNPHGGADFLPICSWVTQYITLSTGVSFIVWIDWYDGGMNKALREKVLSRDGNKCVACGKGDNLSIDHVIPRWVGGSDSVHNLQVMCKTCNERKGFLVNLPLVQRIQSALSVFNLMAKLKLEMRGEIVSRVFAMGQSIDLKIAPLLGQISTFQSAKDIHTVKINGLENTVKYLTDRLNELEKYHKIEYVHEVVETKGYRKLKKPQ